MNFLTSSDRYDRPVQGSISPLVSWLCKYNNHGDASGRLLQAIQELESYFLSLQARPCFVSPAQLPPAVPAGGGAAQLPHSITSIVAIPRAPLAIHQNTFLGFHVDGNPHILPNLIHEIHFPSSGNALRIYIGDGLSALSVHHTGQITACEQHTTTNNGDDEDGMISTQITTTRDIHVVINCAAAEEPYKYFNTHDNILYANVVSLDIPTPQYNSSQQRPNWTAALRAAHYAYELARQPPSSSTSPPTFSTSPSPAVLAGVSTDNNNDINILIHCRMGMNRSVVTTALILASYYSPESIRDIEMAICHIHEKHPIATPMDVYKRWAQDELNKTRDNNEN